MPQRFERYAEVFAHHVGESSTERLEKTEVPVTALSTGHVAVDLNVFCLDHSGTKKAGVLRTDQGEDGDAPMGVSLGNEGWCLGIELRKGRQHSQKGLIGFLSKMLQRPRKVTGKPFLVRTDTAHHASQTLVELCRQAKVDFVVKWNPPRADLGDWTDQTLAHGRVSQPRRGNRVVVFSPWIPERHNDKTYRVRLIIRVTERISHPKGHMFLR